MKYEDLSFDMVNEDGVELTCDILSVVPDGDNTYIIFTNYMTDDDDNFILQYGKIVKNGEDAAVMKVHDEKTINRIKKINGEFAVGYVNRQIQQNLE